MMAGHTPSISLLHYIEQMTSAEKRCLTGRSGGKPETRLTVHHDRGSSGEIGLALYPSNHL